MKGKFIVIEGVDFTGKTTQSRRISNLLSSLGIENINTREPGGTPLGEVLREFVLSGGDEGKILSKEAVLLLFTAARADNIFKVIKPALEAGKTVICDRFLASTLAYQHVLFGFSHHDILELHRKFNYNLFPDVTILLDATPEILLQRRNRSINIRNNNKYDFLPLEVVDALRQKFLDTSQIRELNTSVVESKETEEETFKEISMIIKKLLKDHE